MMSDVPEPAVSDSVKPQQSFILKEGRKNDRDDPDQPLQSSPPHESPTVEVAGDEEEDFSFEKLVQQNPNVSWGAAELGDKHDPDQPPPSLPPHGSPTVEVAEAEKDFFSFSKLVQENPNLSLAAADGDKEPLAATMSPMRPSPHAAISPDTSRSEVSSSDSLMRYLLQPPPIGEPEKIRSPSSTSPPRSPLSKEGSFKQGQLDTAFLEDSRAAEDVPLEGVPVEDVPLEDVPVEDVPVEDVPVEDVPVEDVPVEDVPQRRSLRTPSPQGRKRRRTESDQSPQSEPEGITSPQDFIDTGLGDLDAKSILFWAKQRKLIAAQPKPPATSIDPYTVGLEAVNEALRDGSRLSRELQRNRRDMWWRRRRRPCACDVVRHPSSWSLNRIQDVHNHSFLLDCQGLEFSRDMMVAANISETIAVYDVLMDQQNPVKRKAEQVLRFVDIEVGYGDRTCYNLHFYVQPASRRILLAVHKNRVVGILVAEKITQAHRILRETRLFMELEENPVPVRVGINRLWVHVSMRRRHLATLLCKIIAYGIYENEVLQPNDYAFNNNSPVMVMFAKVYLKTVRPPLYHRLR